MGRRAVAAALELEALARRGGGAGIGVDVEFEGAEMAGGAADAALQDRKAGAARRGATARCRASGTCLPRSGRPSSPPLRRTSGRCTGPGGELSVGVREGREILLYSSVSGSDGKLRLGGCTVQAFNQPPAYVAMSVYRILFVQAFLLTVFFCCGAKPAAAATQGSATARGRQSGGASTRADIAGAPYSLRRRVRRYSPASPVPISNRDEGSGVGEGQCDRAAQSPSGAGDQRGLPVQIEPGIDLCRQQPLSSHSSLRRIANA